MRILHISTHNENCGIGKYQEMYVDSMSRVDDSIENTFFPVSPNVMHAQNESDFSNTLDQLKKALPRYDIVHIQHEFSFFGKGQLSQIVDVIKTAKKPLISTIHTSPPTHTTNISRLSPKWPVLALRSFVANKRDVALVSPLTNSLKTIVHNSFTKQKLVEVGFKEDTIIVKPIPVPMAVSSGSKFSKDIQHVKARVSYKSGDFLFATIGYLNAVKGNLHAIKALSLLPDNYKLLVFGGIHPRGNNDDFLDELSDYIIANKLQNRVHITGFVEDDQLLNAYAASVDLVVYPYLRQYSSSSAALNNGFANEKPVLAFPARAFKEINNDNEPVMDFAESFSYYDLAKSIESFDKQKITAFTKHSASYKKSTSYDSLAKDLINVYSEITRTN